jgi:3-methyladenine DNA glycosylase/8-oxoguanine DNA glycosylase
MSPGNPLIKETISQLWDEGVEIRKKLGNLEVLLERNTVTLEEHVRRTAAAEGRLDLLEGHIEACPARKKADASAFLYDKIRDLALIAGLLVLLFKDLWPALLALLKP